MKRWLLCLLLVAACFSQTAGNYSSVPDITPGGTAVAITPGVHTYSRMIQINALSTNTGLVRWGGPNIGASQGAFIAAGFGQCICNTTSDLSTLYVYAAGSDKVTVSWQNY